MSDDQIDEFLLKVTEMDVESVSLTFAMKRTVKLGDEWHGFEASESWMLRHPDGGLSPDAARKVALVHGPALIKNIVTALHVGGVLPLTDAKEVIERVKRTYGLLAGGLSDTTGHQPDVSATGGAGDSAGADAGAGDGLSPGPLA